MEVSIAKTSPCPGYGDASLAKDGPIQRPDQPWAESKVSTNQHLYICQPEYLIRARSPHSTAWGQQYCLDSLPEPILLRHLPGTHHLMWVSQPFMLSGNCQEHIQLVTLLPLNWLVITFSVRIPTRCGRSCFGLFHCFRANVWASACGRNLLAVEWIIVCSTEED